MNTYSKDHLEISEGELESNINDILHVILNWFNGNFSRNLIFKCLQVKY